MDRACACCARPFPFPLGRTSIGTMPPEGRTALQQSLMVDERTTRFAVEKLQGKLQGVQIGLIGKGAWTWERGDSYVRTSALSQRYISTR